MLPNSNEIEIKWDKIKTIGSDVILINLKWNKSLYCFIFLL
jgi:sporulation protein YlmC with PRC-barrel domain